MNRTGLGITLGIALAVGLIFGIWPDLDLKLAALFYEPPPKGFWRSYDPVYLRLRDAVTWLIALVALRHLWRSRSSWSGRDGRC